MKINIIYKFVDMYTVTKVAEAFVLVTVPFKSIDREVQDISVW